MYAVVNQRKSSYIGVKHIRMKILLPDNVKKIINILLSSGHEAYAVGGCVRDSILGKTPADWDITTSAQPKEVKALFPRSIDTGIEHGTVTVLMDKVGYEVTTYRIDGEYEDARHPSEVTFTTNLVEDLKRRDFTINAMAYNEDSGLVDAFDGMGDLKRGCIRCVGDPRERFTEDALRMFRAVRFAAQLDFSIEETTQEAIRELAPNIAKVSAERIQVELVKLLVSDHPYRMRDVYELGLSAVFMPEFDAAMKTTQHNRHHCYTVGEHTIHAMEGVTGDKVLRLTMLLHDIGKPVTRTTDEDGWDHFIGHEAIGADMARTILRRLKFDNDTIRRVTKLVRYHDVRPKITPEKIRRTMVKIGLESFPQLFDVKRADVHAQSEYQHQEKLEAIDNFEIYYRIIMEKKQPLAIKDLAIDGKDLLEMGVRPGPQLGELLNRMLDLVLSYPEKNKREYLLGKAREYIE